MSQNPYSAPQFPGGPWPGMGDPRPAAQSAVSGPAIGLMVVAGLSIGLLALSISFDLYLLLSGAAKNLPRKAFDPETTIAIRTIWGLVILAASAFTFYGALQMKNLRTYQLAWTTAIVASIPCVGPCCLLGMPFGIWAMVVLSKPEVKAAFSS